MALCLEAWSGRWAFVCCSGVFGQTPSPLWSVWGTWPPESPGEAAPSRWGELQRGHFGFQEGSHKTRKCFRVSGVPRTKNRYRKWRVLTTDVDLLDFYMIEDIPSKAFKPAPEWWLMPGEERGRIGGGSRGSAGKCKWDTLERLPCLLLLLIPLPCSSPFGTKIAKITTLD